jgi:hypothetical protein
VVVEAMVVLVLEVVEVKVEVGREEGAWKAKEEGVGMEATAVG